MSVPSQDVCIACSKTIKQCHRYTKLKPKELKRCKNWICEKCANGNDSDNFDDMINDIENDCESLTNQLTVFDVDLEEKFYKNEF